MKPAELLALLDALVWSDGLPPGLEGRLAVGVLANAEVAWWLASFDKKSVRTEFSAERLAGANAHCVWMLRMASDASEGELPDEGFETVFLEGDRALLARIQDRYFRGAQRALSLRAQKHNNGMEKR